MAVFNKIIKFDHSIPSFDFTTRKTKGVEKCVKEYLDGYLLTNPQDKISTNFKFRLVFHGAQELCSGHWQAEQDFLLDPNTKVEPYPIIHLTTFDIFEHDIPKLPTKRYRKIMDSSIWNYYVPLEVVEKDAAGNVKRDKDDKPIWKYDNNYELLEAVLKEIAQNTQNHLYELAVTHEFADLNARLVGQSVLNGTHNIISPFLFHSEKEMRGFIKSYEEKNRKTLPLPSANMPNQAGAIFGVDDRPDVPTALPQAQEPASSDKTDVQLDTIRKFRWRFLLLDDKSIDRMTRANDKSTPVDICKLKILARNLTRLGFDEDKIWFRVIDFKELRQSKNQNRIIDEKTQKIIHEIAKLDPQIKILGKVTNGSFDPITNKYSNAQTPNGVEDIQIVIDCVKHVDAAQYCLQKYKYEIVLLDYLLDKDKIASQQEYGFQLLEELNAWHNDKQEHCRNNNPELESIDKIYVPGPNNRFFFMFTSAFTTAVHERLLAEGFAKSERGLWYIGDGACPTNTPCLFSYQLMLLMRHRIKDIRKSSEGESMSIIDLLEKIYVEKGKAGTEEIRQKAHEHFNHVLFMREKYKRLEKDFSKVDEDWLRHHPNDAEYILNKMKSSLLVQSAFKVVHHFSGAFFEHLQHLVYLTAFGTLRQWQDMWEEYVFVNKELYDYDGFVNEKDENGKERKRGKAISDAIREYIINLKENNY
jgi:hypothetical protein